MVCDDCCCFTYTIRIEKEQFYEFGLNLASSLCTRFGGVVVLFCLGGGCYSISSECIYRKTYLN